MTKRVVLAPLAAALGSLAHAAPSFPDQELVCGFNAAREQQRQASAQQFAQPVVSHMLVNGAQVWTTGSTARPTLRPGDLVTLKGTGFGAGTDKGAPTKALPEIWTEQAKFKEHSDKLQAESVKLAAAAKTGNLDNLKTAFGAAAGTCKACHDNYRAK